MEIKNQLNKEDFPVLFKFIDLSKLIDFLITGKFHFTRLDYFEDKSEAISQRQLAKSFEHNIPFPFQIFPEIAIEIRQKSYFASCWFGANRESVAMWNLYSDINSVALRFNFDDFNSIWEKENIQISPSFKKIDKIYINKMVYKDYFNINDALTFKNENNIIGFHKDKSFEHEKEVRILIKMITKRNSPTNFEYIENKSVEFYKIKNIKIKTIPFEIVFHPKMHDWQKENIKKLILKYKYKNIKCTDSEIKKLLSII